jgi:hypothetical protein
MYKWMEQMVLYVFMQKSSGLRTIKLAFGLCFFSPEQTGSLDSPVVFSCIFHLAFTCSIYSFYLHK